MTQPPPPEQPPAGPPAGYPYPPPGAPPGPPGGRPKKGIPGWGIALIIVGVLLCCIGPAIACAIGLIATNFGRDLAATPEAKVVLTSCDIHNDELHPYAELSYETTNVGDGAGSFTVELLVYDDRGGQVGSGHDWVWNLPAGDTTSEQTTVYLDRPDGSSCDIRVTDTYIR